MKFLFKPRLNYVDAFALGLCWSILDEGHIILAVIIFVASIIISTAIEMTYFNQ